MSVVGSTFRREVFASRLLRSGAAGRCRTRRPAVTKDNRLSGGPAPALVGERGAIRGHDGDHGMDPLRWDFHLLTRCRGKADGERKSVYDRRGKAAPSRCDCKSADEGFPGHWRSPSVFVDTVMD